MRPASSFLFIQLSNSRENRDEKCAICTKIKHLYDDANIPHVVNACYILVFDTFKKKKALQPLKTRACSALWSVHEI